MARDFAAVRSHKGTHQMFPRSCSDSDASGTDAMPRRTILRHRRAEHDTVEHPSAEQPRSQIVVVVDFPAGIPRPTDAVSTAPAHQSRARKCACAWQDRSVMRTVRQRLDEGAMLFITVSPRIVSCSRYRRRPSITLAVFSHVFSHAFSSTWSMTITRSDRRIAHVALLDQRGSSSSASAQRPDPTSPWSRSGSCRPSARRATAGAA